MCFISGTTEHLKADEIYYTPLVSIRLGQILPLARMPDFMKHKTETGEIAHHWRFPSGFRCFLTQFNIDVVISGEISLEDNPICDCPKMWKCMGHIQMSKGYCKSAEFEVLRQHCDLVEAAIVPRLYIRAFWRLVIHLLVPIQWLMISQRRHVFKEPPTNLAPLSQVWQVNLSVLFHVGLPPRLMFTGFTIPQHLSLFIQAAPHILQN